MAILKPVARYITTFLDDYNSRDTQPIISKNASRSFADRATARTAGEIALDEVAISGENC